MLADEIEKAQRLVRTDAYQMSIGEVVTMYEQGEIVVDPEYQRLFRWKIGQKSKLIESILLGIPVPSIFVFERKDSSWELIDGLQRISTILEFMGKLSDPDGGLRPPSILEATKYLPSLHNSVWEKTDRIDGVPKRDQRPFSKGEQLAIRRARLGVEILKRPSDDKTKFDLFQRLNAGGTQANAQELRNCIILMVNKRFFRAIKNAAEQEPFKTVSGVTEDQMEKQRHIELACRFLVHANIQYRKSLDVEEFIDESVVELANNADLAMVRDLTGNTFSLLNDACGPNALRRFENGRHTGKVSLVAIEAIAVGVARNLAAISKLKDPVGFVRTRIEQFWTEEEIERFLSPGLRGTIRIERTVPFGESWFKP